MARTKTVAKSLTSSLLGVNGWKKCERIVFVKLEFASGKYEGPALLTAERTELPDSPWSGVVEFKDSEIHRELCIVSSELINN